MGADSTLAIALGAVGRKGIVVLAGLAGLAGGSVPFSFFATSGEAQLTTSMWGSRNELAEVIALAEQGRLHGHVERHPLTASTASSNGSSAARSRGAPSSSPDGDQVTICVRADQCWCNPRNRRCPTRLCSVSSHCSDAWKLRSISSRE